MRPENKLRPGRWASCAVATLLSLRAVSAADYANFSQLPELEKDRVVWTLCSRNEWGSPDQKPVCEDVLLHQGYSFANSTGWTSRAIDLAEKQGWSEFRPLVQKIYDRPLNHWNYERAFRYLRAIDGHPVPEKLIKASQTIEASGRVQDKIPDEMLEEKDQEAVLVYALKVACWHAGKGGTERGREAAANVLKSLPREVVSRRLVQLYQDAPADQKSQMVKSEVEWVMRYLEIPVPNR